MAAAAVAPDAPSACRQHFYAHKVVRDLLWAFCSPHMLAAAHFPVLPTRMFGADEEEVQHHPRVIAWLRALDADPSHLVAFLRGATRSKGKMLALGVYFATLLEYWLRFCPLFHVERFALGKQIVSASGQTVGQLKFLLRLTRCADDDDASLSSSSSSTSIEVVALPYQDLHVESSVKFFLLHPLEDADTAATQHPVQLEQFVGPHLGENLAWRVQEVARKLAMCRGESVQRWLETHYSDAVTSHMVLRGYLFYPLSHFARTADVTQRHDWAFHTNPTTASRTVDSVLDCRGQDQDPLSHPSIAPDHLRGWWTSDLARELPAKVHANTAAGVGPSRFAVLPKLHWLSPVVAHEATVTDSADAVIVDGDASLGIETLELLTLDALVAVAQEHFATVASTPQATSAVIMPLLIAELVRCQPDDVEYEAASDAPQRWKELSRGFALDPASWDPRPLCHDAVRFRRVAAASNSTSASAGADTLAAREYEGRREWVHGSVIVKPSDDELAQSLERKQHAFAQPHSIAPRALCDELLTVVGASRKPSFTHTNLKASIRTVLESQHEQQAASLDSVGDAAAAFVLACLQCLMLPASERSSSSQTLQGVKAAQRVGHLILDAFEVLAPSAQSHPSDNIDKRGWQALCLRVVQDIEAWSYVFLALRAADVICRRSGTGWLNDSETHDAAPCHPIETVAQDLLRYRTLRANAIAVETIKVFWLSGRSGLDPERTTALVHAVFGALVDAADWTSAEHLAVQSHDLALQQQLAQRFVRLSMLKALKRLHRAMAEQHVAQHPHDRVALRSLGRHHDSSHSLRLTYAGPLIDHEANRSLLTLNGPPLLSWEFVETPSQLNAMLTRLATQEQDIIAACAIGEGDPLAVMRRVVIGMDCEWRPQFLRSSAATGVDEENERENDEVDDAPSSEPEGLSVYQLAIGDRVFVVDVQALGEAAAAPLEFIWTRPATFTLVGFCVTSDVKRLAVSFPGLFAPSGNGDEDENDSCETSDKLLVELKQLALYRRVPASKWGLAQLARVCLDDDVDKEEQCSDWSARPLTQSQLTYAAKDAFAVQQITLHLLADVPSQTPADILACLKQFAVVTVAAAPSFGHWVAAVPPLSLDDVRVALTELELTDAPTFHTIARSDGTWDGSVRTPHGVVVKTIAVVVRSSSSSSSSDRARTALSRYAAVVVALDGSIDMAALGQVLGVAADDVVLADQQTLIRVFGYSRGCVGPLGLREQQDIQVVVDERLLAEDRLLCGAGAIDHVYAIAPAVLVEAAQAVVASISERARDEA